MSTDGLPVVKKQDARIRVFAIEVWASDENLNTTVHWDDLWSGQASVAKRERIFMVAIQQFLLAALEILRPIAAVPKQ
jgi:hypothetical protein